MSGRGVADFRYRLLPVFSNLLPADAAMADHIAEVRRPHEAKLAERLAVTQGLLYRRGNFNGTWDQLILDAITYPYSTLNEFTGAQIKTILEDVADNLLNPDPCLQQGGDMVRVGAMSYVCTPHARMGARIVAGNPGLA